MLQLGNGTSSGWQWSTLEANLILCSRLTIHLYWQANSVAGLRLGYQVANGPLCTLIWNVGNRNVAGEFWQLRKGNPLSIISNRAPLASFTWGIAQLSGLAIMMNTLSSNSHSIRADWWTGAGEGKWLPPQTSTVMNNFQNYTSPATNADAHVYALQDRGVKDFHAVLDGTTYILVDDVITS